MGRADLNSPDDLDQIHPIAFGKCAPFIEKGEDSRPVTILYNLAGLAFNGPIQDSEGEFIDIYYLRKEFGNTVAGFIVYPAAYPPEIPDGFNVIAAGHNALVRVGKGGLFFDITVCKGLLEDWVCDIFGCSRGRGPL